MGPIQIMRIQADAVVAQGPYESLIEFCNYVLTYCGFAVGMVNPAGGYIQASSSMSLFSWGENVALTLRTMPEGGIWIAVQSSLKFGLIDWGKNRRNVEKIISTMMSLAPSWG